MKILRFNVSKIDAENDLFGGLRTDRIYQETQESRLKN